MIIGNILATASASLPSKPSPSIPVLLSSTLPFGGLPDKVNDTVPSRRRGRGKKKKNNRKKNKERKEEIRSFLMTSIGWNCTPSIEGMVLFLSVSF